MIKIKATSPHSLTIGFEITIRQLSKSYSGVGSNIKNKDEIDFSNEIIDKLREIELGGGARAFNYWDMKIENTGFSNG